MPFCIWNLFSSPSMYSGRCPDLCLQTAHKIPSWLRPYLVLRLTFLCSILTLKVLPTLSNTLSPGTHLLVSARLLPAVRLVGLLQAGAWISHQLPLALTSLRERCFLGVPTTPYTQYPPVKRHMSLVTSLLALTVMVWTQPTRSVKSLRFAPWSLYLSSLLLLIYPGFFSAPSPPSLALPSCLVTLHLKRFLTPSSNSILKLPNQNCWQFYLFGNTSF